MSRLMRYAARMARYAITGSTGRIGRAIHRALVGDHDVVGLDRSPCSATSMIADLCDEDALKRAFEGCEAVYHTAALHAPHVDLLPDEEFERVNVEGTDKVLRIASQQGVRRVILTSTTALYGYASHDDGKATWITEETTPQPRTIYHRTKLAAEALARDASSDALKIGVIRMSRCFPEAAPLMAVYRLHRGIDARDVAKAHLAAAQADFGQFGVFNISGQTPFKPDDCEALKSDAGVVLRERSPDLAEAFDARQWPLPRSIDRIYVADKAEDVLGWKSEFGFAEVIDELDRGSSEVLPA